MSYYPVSLCGQPKQISPMSSTSSLSSGVSFLQPMPPLIYPGTTAGMAPLPKTVHLNMSNPPQTTNMHPLRSGDSIDICIKRTFDLLSFLYFRANGKPLCNRPKFQCKFCVFCKSNGEDESFYYSHELKDSNGYVSCPILASYTCPVCKATGKFAHTMKYCPVNRVMDLLHYEQPSLE